MSKKDEGEFSGVIIASSDLSLEERVTALEKQLTDMQAAMSCDLGNIIEASSAKWVGFSCHEFGLHGTTK